MARRRAIQGTDAPGSPAYRGWYVVESIYRADPMCLSAPDLTLQVLRRWADSYFTYMDDEEQSAGGYGACVRSGRSPGSFYRINDDCTSSVFADAACALNETRREYHTRGCAFESYGEFPSGDYPGALGSGAPWMATNYPELLGGALAGVPAYYKVVSCWPVRPVLTAPHQRDLTAAPGAVASDPPLLQASFSCAVIELSCRASCTRWPRSTCVKSRNALGECTSAACAMDATFWVFLSALVLVLLLAVLSASRRCVRRRRAAGG